MKKEVSAGIVLALKHSRKFLLLHYDAGHWDLPKGHVEKGESIEQTALRELEEETSITNVELIPNFKEKIHYFFKKEGELISKDVYFLLGFTNNSEVKLSHEHKDYVWLSSKAAIDKCTFETAKKIIQRAEEFLKHEK